MARSDLDDKPTEAHIRALHEHIAGSYWAPQRELDLKFIDLFYDQHAVPTPNTADKGRKWRVDPERMTTGEPARIIGLSQSFYITPPKFDAQFVGADAYNATRAENVSRALNEAIDQLNPPTGDQPWTDGVEVMHLLGRVPDLIIPTNKHYADYPMKKSGESEKDAAKRRREWKLKSPLPIMWLTLPADTTYPAYLSTMNDEALSEMTMSYAALQDMFSSSELSGVMPDDPKHYRDEVTLGIYANRNWLAYCLLSSKKEGTTFGIGGQYKDKILRVIEHKMGRCAIRIHPGLTSARKEPGYYWRSQLYPVLGLLETFDKLATIARTGAKFDVAPILKEWRHATALDDGDGARSQVEEFFDVLTLDPGDPQSGRGREDIQPLVVPQNSQQVRELMIWISERISRITGAVEILEGTGAPNQTAWSENFKAETAKGKLRPLTHRHIGRGLGIAESIQAALTALGEDIALAKVEDGHRVGAIVLKVKEMEDFRPVLSGTYDAQLPMNQRADVDIGMKLQQLALDGKLFGYSPQSIARDYFKQESPWLEHKDTLIVRYMTSDKVLKIQLDDIAEAFEADLSDEDKMTMAQIEAQAAGLPQPTIEILKKYGLDAPQIPAPGTMPPPMNGNGAGPPPTVNPQTAGAIRAATPYSTQGTGPQPQEQL